MDLDLIRLSLILIGIDSNINCVNDIKNSSTVKFLTVRHDWLQRKRVTGPILHRLDYTIINLNAAPIPVESGDKRRGEGSASVTSVNVTLH